MLDWNCACCMFSTCLYIYIVSCLSTPKRSHPRPEHVRSVMVYFIFIQLSFYEFEYFFLFLTKMWINVNLCKGIKTMGRGSLFPTYLYPFKFDHVLSKRYRFRLYVLASLFPARHSKFYLLPPIQSAPSKNGQISGYYILIELTIQLLIYYGI